MSKDTKDMCCLCKYLVSPFKGESFEFRSDMDCGRHSPTLVMKQHGRTSVFPPVRGDDWCGDFEKMEAL